MWDNHEDARMRCSGTVVRYKDKPVYIHEVQHDMSLKMSYLLSQRTVTVDIMSPLIDWKPVPTGFVNTPGHAAYVCRRPVRKWKQGLHRDNIRVNEMRQRRLHPGDLIRSREFGRCVMRDYPSFEDTLRVVEAGQDNDRKVTSRAFHPEFALFRSNIGLVWLVYRGEKVGWYENEHLRLGEGQEHLIQSYEEAVA